MKFRPALSVAAATISLSAAVFMQAEHATASTAPSPLSCYSPNELVYCTQNLYGYGSAARWTFDYSAQMQDNGQSSVTFYCGGTGKAWAAGLSYSPGFPNSDNQWSVQGTCAGPQKTPPDA